MAPKLHSNNQGKKYIMISLQNWTKESKIIIKPNFYPVKLHLKLFRAAVGAVGDDTKIAQKRPKIDTTHSDVNNRLKSTKLS